MCHTQNYVLAYSLEEVLAFKEEGFATAEMAVLGH